MGGGSQGGKGKVLAQQLRVLLIDEVSMLAAEFLDLLDVSLRKLVSRYGRGAENEHRAPPRLTCARCPASLFTAHSHRRREG